jgi:hypothetical protein
MHWRNGAERTLEYAHGDCHSSSWCKLHLFSLNLGPASPQTHFPAAFDDFSYKQPHLICTQHNSTGASLPNPAARLQAPVFWHRKSMLRLYWHVRLGLPIVPQKAEALFEAIAKSCPCPKGSD